MHRTSLAIAVAVVFAATSVAQTPPPPPPPPNPTATPEPPNVVPPPPLAIAPPAALKVEKAGHENVAPPPPTVIGDPPAEVVEVSPVETLVAPRFVVSGEIGPAWAWRTGQLRPTGLFGARSYNFPIPSARFDDVIDSNDQSPEFAARLAVAYTFERMPLTVIGAWETVHAEGNAHLLGYNANTFRLLNGLNNYNRDRRDDKTDGWWPVLRMRDVPGESTDLRTRFTSNVATATASWKLWTPREDQGWEYRLLAGGRYGGFFTDDRAIGDRYEQSASNWYNGFGPEGGLRLHYTLRRIDASEKGHTRLWLDARGGALFGETMQRFRELDLVMNGGDVPFRELLTQSNRTVPFFAGEAGIEFCGPRAKLSIGARYNQYWGIGDIGPSRLDIGFVTGFLRLDVGF